MQHVLTRRIVMTNKNSFYEYSLKNSFTIGDLKNKIARDSNLKMEDYYLFYNNINLLENYDSMMLSELLPKIDYEDFSKEDVFNLISKKEFLIVLITSNKIHCLEHPTNSAYLFCKKCDEALCDKCKLTKHKTHQNDVIDQNVILDNYFKKMEHFEWKYNKAFGKIEISSLFSELDSNLSNFVKSEVAGIVELAEDLKRIIDDIKMKEVERINSLKEAAKMKLEEFKKEINFLDNLMKRSSDKNKKQGEEFFKLSNSDKLEYVRKIQEEITELLLSEGRINKTIEKLKSVQTIKISEMLEFNKDHSYFINFTRLKSILENKKQYVKTKLENENHHEIYENMENLSLQSRTTQFFNPSLDVMKYPTKTKFIFLPIDNENLAHIFNFETKSVDKVDLDLKTVELPYIPKYSRSLNIQGKVYVMGGEIFNQITHTFIQISYEYFPERNDGRPKYESTIKLLAPMEHGRSGHTVINIDNHKIFAVSGAYSEKTCEYYEFAKEKWTLFPGVNEDRIGCSLLLKNNEDLYCFFGKKWDISLKKWVFLESVEKVNLYEKYPKWQLISFRNLISDNLKKRAFAGILMTPNDKVFILGGQVKEETSTKTSNNVVEVNVNDLSISPAEVNLPKPTTFIDNNFYIFHNNNVQFDVNGNIIFYSQFYKEIWIIENVINSAEGKIENKEN